MSKVPVSIFALIAALSLSQEGQGDEGFELPHREFVVEAASRYADEQYLRFYIIELLHTGGSDEEIEVVSGLISEADQNNTAWLKGALSNYSWPDIQSLDQGQTVKRLWTIVSHADHDPSFQSRVLADTRPLIEAGSLNVSPGRYANLFDSVTLVTEGHQVFGTHLECVDGLWTAENLIEPEDIDIRRASIGLNVHKEYIADHSQIDGSCG